MSSAADSLEAHAEVLKLAALLERDPSELAYLDSLAPGDVRALREQTTEVLWSASRAALGKIAAASRLLPASVTATIGERAFGPLLSARLTELLDPERAVAIANRMPVPFLAEVAVALDPRRATPMISLIEAERIGQITAVLSQRGEYVAMGGFVGHLDDDALTVAIGVMDGATLLRVGFVLDDKRRLQRLIGLLEARRLQEIIAAAARDSLWLEALDLLGHLSLALQAELIAGAAKLNRSAVRALAAAVVEHDRWDQGLMIAEREPALATQLAPHVAALPARRRKQLATAARRDGRLSALGLLGEALAP